jgi:nitrile hydratase accessory protein
MSTGADSKLWREPGEAPVFREPWEAQAFAMVLTLHQQGLFTWAEWAEMLSSEIAAAQAQGDPDTGGSYYGHWLRALERLVSVKGMGSAAELARYRQAWNRAAQRTPHGQPVLLNSDDLDCSPTALP